METLPYCLAEVSFDSTKLTNAISKDVGNNEWLESLLQPLSWKP